VTLAIVFVHSTSLEVSVNLSPFLTFTGPSLKRPNLILGP